MKAAIKKYSILLLFVYLTVWASLASTPLTELFRPPLMLSRVYSLMLYLPFAAVILWKLVQDTKRSSVNLVNAAYYLFACYYAVLTAYRFFNSMEIKENIYYSVVLFGSVALFLQIRDRRLDMEEDDYRMNFTGILLYMVVYKIIATMLSVDMFGIPRLIGNPPVNNLYSTSMLIMLFPFMVDGLKANKFRLNWLLLCSSLVLAAICKSRAIVFLMMAVLAILVICNLRDRYVFKRLGAAIICAVLIIGIMAMLDMGEVRYALNRELGLFSQQNTQPALSNPTAPMDITQDAQQQNTQPALSNPTAPTDITQDPQNQIQKSDIMRGDLVQQGIKQVKQNLLFGTGDLYYPYDLGYMVLQQTPHNFLLESLVCYGLIGTAIIALLLISMLFDVGFFKCKKPTCWREKTSMLVVIGYFFALGMVQPSVYNTMLCPLFTVIIAYYGNTASGEDGKWERKK